MYCPRFIALSVLVVLIAAACARDSSPPTSRRPNILILLADDLGYSDIGSFGGEIETPHLDRLAEQGVRFTQFYNAGRCCPTRASLLTGLYPHQAGVGLMTYRDFGRVCSGNLNGSRVILGDVLGSAGYRTMFVGKWHAGHHPRPAQRSEDSSIGKSRDCRSRPITKTRNRGGRHGIRGQKRK